VLVNRDSQTKGVKQMPEFVLDHGTKEASDKFKGLDAFTQGYIEAMFFTECHADNPDLEYKTLSHLSPLSWKEITKVCKEFQETNHEALQIYYKLGRSEAHAGHDFWLTRNGHGAGFWDGGNDVAYTELTDGAHLHGECYVYLGDDGLIYTS
jgi:hypothetical protein